ncbi:hypothetical protein GEMRC1_003558 [Eukaryota sp. GEM-RC1]
MSSSPTPKEIALFFLPWLYHNPIEVKQHLPDRMETEMIDEMTSKFDQLNSITKNLQVSEVPLHKAKRMFNVLHEEYLTHVIARHHQSLSPPTLKME